MASGYDSDESITSLTSLADLYFSDDRGSIPDLSTYKTKTTAGSIVRPIKTTRPTGSRYSRSAWKYSHDGNVSGYVLVIVNYKFDREQKLKRGNDIEKIKKLFSQYGYKVRSGTNLNKAEILAKVKRYSEKTNSGSFICFLSSHGDLTSLSCPDGNEIEIATILNEAKKREIQACPKIFFIDACRSKRDLPVDEISLPEPPATHYYIGFSCLNRTYCQIGVKSCGIYFEQILKVFKDGFPRLHREHGIVRDLNHFMNKVHFNITSQHLQIPTIRTTLVGKVFLQNMNESDDMLSDFP